MRRLLISTALAAILAAQPAAAQFVTVSPAATGSSGANANLDNTTENCGFNGDGTKTSVSAAGANSKTATPVSLCTTAADWTGFVAYVTSATSTTRYLFDICSTSNCSTVKAPNLYAEPTTGSPVAVIPVPLNIAAGSTLYVRQQDSSGTNAITIALVGTVRNSQSAPGFNTMTALNVDTVNTNACTSPLTVVGVGSTTFTSVKDPTAATYGAFLILPGRGSANPTASQPELLRLAKEPSGGGSATVLTSSSIFSSATATPYGRQTGLVTFASVPGGGRISAQVLGLTSGDSACAGVYAFN
jgi:hypothetical protein